jgi:hypothetical protein
MASSVGSFKEKPDTITFEKVDFIFQFMKNPPSFLGTNDQKLPFGQFLIVNSFKKKNFTL